MNLDLIVDGRWLGRECRQFRLLVMPPRQWSPVYTWGVVLVFLVGQYVPELIPIMPTVLRLKRFLFEF